MLHFIALLLSHLFFRRIIISGKPYKGKSALWIGNHSNGIVDPTILLALAPVLLRPLAKATLWNNVAMKIFLKLTYAIPVARRQDAEEMAEKTKHSVGLEWIKQVNAKAFKCVHEALCDGKRILIFPEGLSHDDPYMHSLKTGVARMAVDADCDITIQPVILNYSEKNEFRSDVYIQYCEPIFVKNGDVSVDDLMEKIKSVFAENFLQFKTWDEKRNWQYLFKMCYGRVPNSLEEFRTFVRCRREDMDKDAVLFEKIQTMRCMLQANGVSPCDPCWRRSFEGKDHVYWVLKFILRILSFTFITGPVLIIDTLVWGIPVEICNRLGDSKKYNRDVYATMKIAHSLWVFPLWSCFVPGLITMVLHKYMIDTQMWLIWMSLFLSMPVLLLFGLFISEHLNFCAGYFKFGLLKLTFPRALDEMIGEWKDILDKVNQKTESVR